MGRIRSARQRSSGSYPENWNDIARAVKDRAGWRCVRCKHPHETPNHRAQCDKDCQHEQDGKQRMLTVHHLDMNKSNCHDWNLAALCQKCHLEIQARVDFAQNYMFDHSEWIKPFIAIRAEWAKEGRAGWWTRSKVI